MVYSEIINDKLHLLLNKKNKYTKADINTLRKKDNSLTENKARFIVLCTAIFHNTETSNYIKDYHSQKNEIKRYAGGL